MVNIVIHIENKWFFFYSSFSVNLKIYTLHCDPAEEKNIFFFFSQKYVLLVVFFPPFLRGKAPLHSPLPLPHPPSPVLSLALLLDEWTQRRGNTWTHWNDDEHGQRGRCAAGATKQRTPCIIPRTHTVRHVTTRTHAHTHFPHRHPLTVLKQKDKKKKLNLSPNNDIKNKTMWTFTIIISARGQEEAGAAVIL